MVTPKDSDVDQFRPDAGRVISRLQAQIGQQAGQLAQYEDLVEQLQDRVSALVAELARAKLPQAPES